MKTTKRGGAEIANTGASGPEEMTKVDGAETANMEASAPEKMTKAGAAEDPANTELEVRMREFS